MKIEKVNENQIRCTLTREDLASRELKISELAYGTEKAKNLFRDMMLQANYQFGFDAEDIPLMIEAIPLNAECIVLIITKVEEPDELDTRFSRFAPSVREPGEEDLDEEDEEDSAELTDDRSEKVLDIFRRLQEKTAADASAEIPPQSPRDITYLFRFSSLHEVMHASALLKPYYTGKSRLYKLNSGEEESYYLLTLTKEDMDDNDYNRSCNLMSEYGALVKCPSAAASYLEEHFEPLIPEHAVEKLAVF